MSNRLTLAVLAGIAVGCTAPAPPASTPAPLDSATGIISITGTSFQKSIVLRSTSASVALAPSAADSVSLSRLGGIEVMVEGLRTPTGFRVDKFKAISVGGRPVVDGIIRPDGNQFFLEHDGKRTLIGNPPNVLRSMPGARVWIGGPLTTGPNTFGIITPATL